MEIMLVVPYGLIQVSKVSRLTLFLISETLELYSPYNALLCWWILVADFYSISWLYDRKWWRKQLHLMWGTASQVQGRSHTREGPMLFGKIKPENISWGINTKVVLIRRSEITHAYLAWCNSLESFLGYFDRFKSNYTPDSDPLIYTYSSPII